MCDGDDISSSDLYKKSCQNEVNIPYCALLVFKSGNIYLNEFVYTGKNFKFEIPKYKQIIQQKLKLSENHPYIQGLKSTVMSTSCDEGQMVHV